jgi:membrane fusion protein (multidrug efflux system)
MKIFLALILVMALGAGYYLSQEEDAPANEARTPAPVPVTVWALEPGIFQSQVNALGTLQAWESVIITASVSEIVDKLYFDGGETVNKGTLLVNLQQDEERAGLRQQQEVLKEHEREVTRLENSGTSLIQTDLDRRRTMAAIARNRIDQEQARLADRNITAPFAGVLGLRQVSRGALVAPGQVITTLDDISRMRLDFTVPAPFLRFLKPGQVIEAKTAAYVESFTGVLAAVDSRVDPVNRSITARATFDNDQGLLKPGLLMQVVVLGDDRMTLLVPEESLVSRAADHFVWKLDGNDATRTPITIGDRRPGWVEVTEGLAAGDRIVRDGVSHLRGNAGIVKIVDD